MPITIFDLAEYRLGREPVSGQDFFDAGLQILGGCEVCGASLAAYNAYPSKTGYWRCRDDIRDTGWESAKEASRDIFEGE